MKRCACCFLSMVLVLLLTAPLRAAEGYLIEALTLTTEQDQQELRIKGNSTPAYTAYQLFDPPRLVIDIAEATMAPGLTLPAVPAGTVHEIRQAHLDDRQPAITRLEVLFASDVTYTAGQENHDIVVSLATTGKEETEEATATAGDPSPLLMTTSQLKARPATTSTGPASPQQAGQPPAPRPLTTSEPGRFDFEFFKNDLHNVFRFFGEVSGRNIVVDEAVRGELTLNLRDVPWDFALDIVLNLKDLQKKERYNTIVISPRAKTFVWPERPGDQLSIRTDDPLAAPAGLAVRRHQETPREHLEAQGFLRQAAQLEKQGFYDQAVSTYERALALWPENSRLAERLASISLIQLGNNARALHFAATALQHDPDNDRAALLAAIAAANMQRSTEARRYFELAVARPRPGAEALISYAAFAEEHGNPAAALALLEQHRQLHGDTLETMIGRARLYDQTGAGAAAAAEYHAILHSGYRLPEDLRSYIEARLTAQGD